MKASIVVILFMFTGSNARSSNCPTPQWFIAEFVSITDQVLISYPIVVDSSLSFFRNVLRFTEEEIVQFEQKAIQFFNTRFGLDFSQSEPDEHGQRFYQNATFFPATYTPEYKLAVTFNRWILSGNTRSVCFEILVSCYRVEFRDEQVLYGTYGGEDGIPVASTDFLGYGFYSIPICPQEPLVFLYYSSIPVRVDPHDGIYVVNLHLYHRVWGHGLCLSVGGFIPTEDGRFHVTLYEHFTFPPHPTFIP